MVTQLQLTNISIYEHITVDLQSRWKEVMDEVILFDAGCGGDDYIVVVVVVVVVVKN